MPLTEVDAGERKQGSADEVLRLLGLARRAGSVIAGNEGVKAAARAGSLRAVLFAGDATSNARRRLEPLLARQAIPSEDCADRARLGAAIGKGAIAVLGITDAALARVVLGRLEASRR